MLAVLKRSESDLRQAIAISPQEINDRDTCGWTALQLSSVSWLTGVPILVEAGADVDCVRTLDGRSLLDVAIEMGSIELLRILAEADCSFLKESEASQWYYLAKLDFCDREISYEGGYSQTRILSAGELPEYFDEWNTTIMMMAQLLVGFIANRRQRLCDLAFEKAPSSVATRFLPMKTDGPYLIDKKASRLALELTSRGITVPLPLNPGKYGETGYHAIWGRPEIADILWNVGFRDVNGRDSCNMTPLMCCPIETSLRFIGWCLGKGFKLNLDVEQDRAWHGENAEDLGEFKPGQPLDTWTIYGMIYSLGSIERYHRPSLRSFVDILVSFEDDRQIAQRIFMASPTDGCKCACSISGCTTRTFLFKGFNDRRGRPYSRVAKTIEIMRFYSDLKGVCNSLLAAEYLRSITFEKLELTHTCCRPHRAEHSTKGHACVYEGKCKTISFSWPMPPSEIKEIHDEESADLQKLAELLAEFETKVVELDLSIPDFISQYWEPRMEQVLRESEGSLDMQALREIGVKIYPSEKPAGL